MALKDWRKVISNSKRDVYKKKKIQDKLDDELQIIKPSKSWSKRYKATWVVEAYNLYDYSGFLSKSAAIKFAKNYMRTH